jgi:predicted  nucleic acid-binding Zn-ribbon protein
VKNEKLKALIEKCNDSHIKLGDECHDMLNELGENEKDPQKVSSMMAKLGTEMKLMMENTTHKVADLLIDGCNMGIKSLYEYINKYTTADEKSTGLAKKLVRIEQEFMNDLLEFL